MSDVERALALEHLEAAQQLAGLLESGDQAGRSFEVHVGSLVDEIEAAQAAIGRAAELDAE